MSSGRALQIAVLTVVMAAIATQHGIAQETVEYVIGAGDVLAVSVWRHSDLDRSVVVRSNGTVTFPPIGDLMAAGLTPTELSREIMQRLRDYTRETTQVTVSMAQFNSRAVFLTGQVVAPGRYSFEAIPDLMRLLSQAGGPLPGADLSNVSIVRPDAGGPRIIKVDVAAYMRGEARTPLPSLQAGDTVEIPPLAAAGGVAGGGLVYVLGEVQMPGPYPYVERLDLLQLIALAGGTTATASLDEVAVVMDGGEGQVVATVDLNKVLEGGTARPFYVQDGDRVVVPRETPGIAGQILGGVGAVLGYTRDVLSSYLVYLTVDRELEEAEAREAAARAARAAAEAAAETE